MARVRNVPCHTERRITGKLTGATLRLSLFYRIQQADGTAI
jgi:hypothetical protein